MIELNKFIKTFNKLYKYNKIYFKIYIKKNIVLIKDFLLNKNYKIIFYKNYLKINNKKYIYKNINYINLIKNLFKENIKNNNKIIKKDNKIIIIKYFK